jgi:hypothetical protein
MRSFKSSEDTFCEIKEVGCRIQEGGKDPQCVLQISVALLTISRPLTSGSDVTRRWIRRVMYLTIGCTAHLLHHPPFI